MTDAFRTEPRVGFTAVVRGLGMPRSGALALRKLGPRNPQSTGTIL